MIKYILLITGLAIVFFELSCNSNPVAPDQPGRRDYVWTVDTLKITDGYFYPSRMWGSSANDVWLAGTGSPSYNLLWHYDGTSWKKDSVSRPINPSALWGSSSNDVWLGSSNSFWRFNGAQWYKFSDINPPAEYDITSIEDIWGKYSDDVWGVGFTDQINGTGYKGIIMHYTGSQWQAISIPDVQIHFISIRGSFFPELLFIEGWQPGQSSPDTFKLYLFSEGNGFKEIYSGIYQMSILQINNDCYFIQENKIYKYIDNSLVLWKDFQEGFSFGPTVGRSESDILGFTANSDYSIWGVGHFNGTSVKVIYMLPDGFRPFGQTVLFNKDIFFSCYSYSTGVTIVIHGQLL